MAPSTALCKLVKVPDRLNSKPAQSSGRVMSSGSSCVSKSIAVSASNAQISSNRSEEHTSELQSQFHLLFPLFFFNDPAPTEIYTLSLHDALPICGRVMSSGSSCVSKSIAVSASNAQISSN